MQVSPFVITPIQRCGQKSYTKLQERKSNAKSGYNIVEIISLIVPIGCCETLNIFS